MISAMSRSDGDAKAYGSQRLRFMESAGNRMVARLYHACAQARGRASGPRQAERECRPGADLAFHRDAPAVPLDNSLRDIQAQAAALSVMFQRSVSLEDAGQLLARN